MEEGGRKEGGGLVRHRREVCVAGREGGRVDLNRGLLKEEAPDELSERSFPWPLRGPHAISSPPLFSLPSVPCLPPPRQFFDIVSKEVSARGAKARQRLQHPEERREEVRVQDEATAGAGGRKEERSGSM